jgi:hypothetical protein
VEAPTTGPVHFKTAVRGAVLSIHAVLAEREGDGWTLSVPKDAADTFVLGIVPETPTSFRLLSLFWEDVEALGKDTGEALELEIDSELRTGSVTWAEIADFGRLPR